MKVIVCDKCRKQINPRKNWFKLHLLEKTNDEMFTNGQEEWDLDLCAECKREFEEFIEL